jgi:hypothetical protein
MKLKLEHVGILHAGRNGERTGKTGKADFEGLIYAD